MSHIHSGRRRRLTAVLCATLIPFSYLTVPAQAQEAPAESIETPKMRITADNLQMDVDGMAQQFIIGYKNPDEGMARIASEERESILTAAAEKAGTRATEVRRMHNGASVVATDKNLTPQEAAAFLDTLNQRPDVAYVQVDTWNYPHATRNDSQYPDQWPMHDKPASASVEPAWDLGYTGNGVTVAVVDTGITDHPDLAKNVDISGGYDFVTDATKARDGSGRDADPHDMGDWANANECGTGKPKEFKPSTWHGTHVAGIVGATANNNQGVTGVAENARIIPVRSLSKCGGPTSDIIDGMAWAGGLSVPGAPVNAKPADVINMSLGTPNACYANPAYQDTIDELNALGKILVVSAGNDNLDAANYSPASCDGVITVAATGPDGSKASYSNRGNVVEISAPGGDQNYIDYSDMTQKKDPKRGFLSTLNDGTQDPANASYQFYDGTSMAAPLVAGIVALMKEARPDLDVTLATEAIQKTAKKVETFGMGAGIINAKPAIEYVMQNPPATTQPGTTVTTVSTAPAPRTTVTPAPVTVTSTKLTTETVAETTTATSVVTQTNEPSPVTVTKTTVIDARPTTVTKTVTTTVPGDSFTTTEVAPGQTLTETTTAAGPTIVEPTTVTMTAPVATVVETKDPVTSTVHETETVTSTNTVPGQTSTVKTTEPAETVTTTVAPSTVTITPSTVTTTPVQQTITEVVTSTVTGVPGTVVEKTTVPGATETVTAAPETSTAVTTPGGTDVTVTAAPVTETSVTEVTSTLHTTVTETTVVDDNGGEVPVTTTTVIEQIGDPDPGVVIGDGGSSNGFFSWKSLFLLIPALFIFLGTFGGQTGSAEGSSANPWAAILNNLRGLFR